MYKVVTFFKDIQDKDHVYFVGDEYPRVGKEVSKERLAELSSSNNKMGKPLIVAVGEEPVKNAITKESIEGMTSSEIRKLAIQEQIEDVHNMTARELKEAVIAKLKL